MIHFFLVRFIVNRGARRRTCASPSRGGQIWALVSHSSRENRRSLFSPSAFLISCDTCRRSSFLPDCSPVSNLEVRYCLTFSEKRTAPPFGLRSAHPSLKFDWKGSLPCLLSITLELSSSQRVRGGNYSTKLKSSDFKAFLMSKIKEMTHECQCSVAG